MEEWVTSRIDENYQVSSIGRIRSIERYEQVIGHWGGTYRRRYGGKILNPAKNRLGYNQITGTNKKFHQVHRLVAHEFVSGYFDGAVVNHKNGIRNDNRPENLEWLTHQENLIHAYKVLGKKGNCFGKFGKLHPKSMAVIGTCKIDGRKIFYDSISCAVKDGFDTGAISKCLSGKLNQHKGFIWERAKK